MENPTIRANVFSSYIRRKFISNVDLEFFFHLIQFKDTTILNIHCNGVIDTTFEIPLLDFNQSLNFSMLTNNDCENIEPLLIMGDTKNIKSFVIASQIGKLFKSFGQTNPIILSIGLKWFNDDKTVDDFEKVLFLLNSVKDLYMNKK